MHATQAQRSTVQRKTPEAHRGTLAAPEPTPAATQMPRPGACACGGGCPRCRNTPVQAKLDVSEPGDALEREADRAAENVMRKTALPTADDAVNRDRLPQERQPLLSRYAAQPAPPSGANVPEAVGEALGSAGRPLEASARDFMESRFGHDFG